MSDLKKLVPPGVKDERQDAFAKTLNDMLGTIDIQSLIMSDVWKVDACLLPVLVVEYSMQEFIEPGLSDDTVRGLLANAYELHEKKGHVDGVRLGLSLLGMTAHWVQWYQQVPKATHDTHVVTVFTDEALFSPITEESVNKSHKAATRMINATKRWSQDVALSFGVRSLVDNYVGAVSGVGGRYVAALPADDIPSYPVIEIVSAASLFGGRYTAGMEIT